MIYAISLQRNTITADELVNLIKISPLERIGKGANGSSAMADCIQGEYAWFLEKTGRKQDEVLDWISIESNRVDAFTHARTFGKSMYDLLQKATGETEAFRFLVI